MLWNVEVTDQTTATHHTVHIEAESAAEAERIALDRGLMVGVVAPMLPLHATPKAPGTRGAPRGGVPEYADIDHGSDLIRTFATVVTALGWLTALAAVLTLFAAFASSGRLLAVNLFVICVWLMLLTAAFFIVAAVLRLYAALACAVRDIAQNSFRP